MGGDMDESLETKKEFAAVMLTLYHAFNKQPDKDCTRVFFAGMKHLEMEDVKHCVSFAMLQGDKFPTLHDLRRYVSQIPRRTPERIEHKPANNQKLAETAMKMVSAIIDGKLSREQIIDGMMIFEKQYPGIGWKEEAAKLVNYYRRSDEDAAERLNPSGLIL